jgi:hypothetical protein
VEHGRLRPPFLGHADLDGFAVEHEHAAIRRPVPGIDLVERPAPQCPDGQVEPERRTCADNERRRG